MTNNQQLRRNRQTRKAIKASVAGVDIVFAAGVADIVASVLGGIPAINVNAYGGGKLRLGNFPNPVVIDMKGVKAMGEQLPLLRDHDTKRPIGHGAPVISSENLKIAGHLSVEGEDSSKIVAAQKNGFQWQASIGGSIPNTRTDVKTVEAGAKVMVNGREHVGPLHVVRAFLWKETSLVALGADEERASASIAAAHNPKRGVLMNEFEKWLSACGIDSSTLDDSQVTNLRGAFEATQKPTPSMPSSDSLVNAAIQSVRTETVRLGRVDRLFSSFKDTIKASSEIDELRTKVIEGTISEDSAHLQLLQASRATATSNVAGKASGRSLDAIAIEASVYREAGLSNDESVEALVAVAGTRENAIRAVDMAQGTEYNRGTALSRIISAACAQSGHYYNGRHENAEIECAMRHSQNIQASDGFSTISLPGILGRTANKAMLAAYAEAQSAGVMTNIASATNTPDFKKFDRYRMTETGIMEQVPAAGEVKFGTLTENAYENQLKTYGKIISISRTMIYNDDLHAFLQVPRMLGRQGYHALEQIGIALLVNAPTAAGAGTTEFFHGAVRNVNDQPNYFEGSTSALSIDSLEVAYELFLNQTDSSGKPIMLNPAILLTCTGDAITARKLFKDTEYRFTTATTKETIQNQWQGMFTPEVSAYLARLGTTLNAVQWYLLSNPTTDVCALQIAYLNGQRNPTITQGELDLTVLGMQWRGIFDFGIGLQDPRAIVKSKGKA